MNKKIEAALVICAILSVYSLFFKFLGLFPKMDFMFSNIVGIISFIFNLILIYLTFKYATRGAFKNVYSVLKIIFLALTFTSLVGVPINLLLHEIIDPNYKERIADYKLERELKELEKYGDSKKISYTFNEEKFRQDVLKNYTRSFFLTNPIRTILINLVFSLIFSAIISKFGTEEDLIIAHESP
ncbi:MAG: hypothetical protein CFE22_11115 [Cytophagaceae bacterium BCCC1]|nr:MAG: hypothetical protein CFE22_11115 [Cytophagaceae bacterium BCCC1]